jgi:hypothetical protein
MITIGLVLMTLGAVFVASFVWLNLRDRSVAQEAVLGDAVLRERSFGFGLLSAGVLIAGVALFALGAAMVGTTLGYGRF